MYFNLLQRRLADGVAPLQSFRLKRGFVVGRLLLREALMTEGQAGGVKKT